MRPETRDPRAWSRERGFSLVTAIFLIVVLAGLGSCIVQVVTQQQATSVLDVSGSRAYQAARAGVEWAAHQVLDPNNTLNPGTCDPIVMPACPASPTHLSALAGSLSSFTVTVTCTPTPATEGNRDIRVFQITATACSQAGGAPPASCPGIPAAGYVERQISATLSKCKDSTAAAPRCACG